LTCASALISQRLKEPLDSGSDNCVYTKTLHIILILWTYCFT